MNKSDQMSLWEEPPVNPFPSRDFAEDLKTLAEISCSNSDLLRLVFAFPGSSGKMSPEFFQAPEDETLRRFWDCSQAGQFKPLEEVAREVAGRTLEYWGAHPPRTESPGPSLMLSTSEFRSGGRRVFVVGYLGDWRRAGAVLFDATSLRGHPAPSAQARKGSAGTTRTRTSERGRVAEEMDQIRSSENEVAGTLSARYKSGGGLGTDFDIAGGFQVSPTLRAQPNASHRADNMAFIPVSKALNAKGGLGRLDAESESFVFDMRGNGDGRTVNMVTRERVDRPTDFTPVVVGTLQASGKAAGRRDPAGCRGWPSGDSRAPR